MRMSFEEFKLNRPKSVIGIVRSDGKLVTRRYYYGYNQWIDRVGWFNRNKGKSITDEVAYQLYERQMTQP